ncbi:hypothetical protein ALP03_00664 [Pseudomonas amygdali pv. tabaci]|uniref:Uncharacterized protein n=1 Tax=Pseudomonas amygdali pv. tabaci TaxID=322 RepID=A0A3M6I4D2_PSEAJ|nr:hypothetical protein ALP03_00664 [Pseudomonas amygdali pv. tabaci]
MSAMSDGLAIESAVLLMGWVNQPISLPRLANDSYGVYVTVTSLCRQSADFLINNANS